MSKNVFADARNVTNLDECLFYHTVDLPGYGTIEGFWDLRGREREYLGNVEFAGKRVLEVGPGSGALSFFMEREGAEVVSVEASESYEWEFCWRVPRAQPADLSAKLEAHRKLMERQRNSYWLCHRALKSKNQIYYGSAYEIPSALGEFDIAVLGCILLHNKNPFVILENCARAAREALIVVEPFRAELLAQSSIEFLPKEAQRCWHEWWGFTPKCFVDALNAMGFPNSVTSFHTQKCFGEPAPLFTVVARRESIDQPAAEANALRIEMKSPVEKLKMETNEITHLPVSIKNLGAEDLSSKSTPPVLLSYHWRKKTGEILIWDGIRTPLPRTLRNGDMEKLLLVVKAPTEAGEYNLEVTLVKETVAWYDERLDELPLRIETTIVVREGI